MKQPLKLLLLILFVSVFPLTASATTANTFNQLVFFGDSLTDNGNLYKIDLNVLPKSPPYYAGRFSNGEVWSEMVTKYFTDKNKMTADNYAIGGESVLFEVPKGPIPPLTLCYSITDYLTHNLFTDKSHTLFVLWMGANDYLNGADDTEKKTTDVVDGIHQAVETLIANGGVNFLLINLPDISKIPMASEAGSDPVVLQQLAQLHNAKLQAAVSNLQNENPSLTIKLYDFSTTFTEVVTHPEIYNEKYQLRLANVTTACWTGGYYPAKQLTRNENIIEAQLGKQLNAEDKLSLVSNLHAFAQWIATSPELYAAYATANAYQNDVKPCADPDTYLFWDHVHPSHAGHTIIGQQLIDFIKQNFTPA